MKLRQCDVDSPFQRKCNQESGCYARETHKKRMGERDTDNLKHYTHQGSFFSRCARKAAISFVFRENQAP